MIKQISIFLPNHPGVLVDLTKLLTDNAINLRALTISETTDYGILKIIVDKTSECIQILERESYLTAVTEVIAIEIPDKPGSLHEVIKLLGENEVNIDYLYSTIVKNGAIIILRVSDNKKVIDLLKSKNIRVLDKTDF
ncbi:MAG: ACT domain-containing protein [Candidatus Lokiarchaeota archaeon]|nr:ACT domain-containing protein [Candidatus Lokiarchaeota archaeon]